MWGPQSCWKFCSHLHNSKVLLQHGYRNLESLEGNEQGVAVRGIGKLTVPRMRGCCNSVRHVAICMLCVVWVHMLAVAVSGMVIVGWASDQVAVQSPRCRVVLTAAGRKLAANRSVCLANNTSHACHLLDRIQRLQKIELLGMTKRWNGVSSLLNSKRDRRSY